MINSNLVTGELYLKGMMSGPNVYVYRPVSGGYSFFKSKKKMMYVSLVTM